MRSIDFRNVPRTCIIVLPVNLANDTCNSCSYEYARERDTCLGTTSQEPEMGHMSHTR